ncbi:MAG: DUF3786 domain-containing protein [Dehalococcoidales bacterium]
MENRNIPVPEQKNYEEAYGLAYQLVREKVAATGDIEEQCRKSGARYQVTGNRRAIIISYLNRPYEISLPEAEVSLVGSDDEIPMRDKLLILHYFTTAKGTPPGNKLITFQELPEGSMYSPTFAQRTINPLTRYFGDDPDKLPEVSRDLGGEKTNFGDVAVTINAFSHVPITILFWKGDEELTPQGNILFDATITDYLATEDITVLCEIITWKLIRQLG